MPRFRQRFFTALFSIALALLLYVQDWHTNLDNTVYDAAVELFPTEIFDDIVIVAIDEKTLLELGQWPFARKYHAQLLQQLHTVNPTAIGLDILFAEHSLNPADDELLIAQVANSSTVVLPVYIEFLDKGNHYLEVLPMAELAIAAPALGHVQVAVDGDGKNRAVYLLHSLGESRQLHFSVALEQLVNGFSNALPGLITEAGQESNAGFVKNYKNYIPLAGGAGTFPSVSFTDVIHGRIRLNDLRGKTLLVGAVAQGMDPVVTALGPMPGVELNANILNGIRNHHLVTPLSNTTILLANLLAVLLWSLLLFSASVRRNIIATVMALLVLNGVSLLGFASGYWLPFGLVTLALVICFPIMNWWRLSGELKILTKELARLKKQDIFSRPTAPLSNILQSIQFLQSFYPLTAWCLRDEDFLPIDKMGECSLGTELSEYSEVWQVTENHGLVKLPVGSDSFYLALQWDSDTNHVGAMQPSLLHKVFPIERWLSQYRLPQKTVVDESMEALAEANKRAQTSSRLMLNTLDQIGHGVLLLEPSGALLKINRQGINLLGEIDHGCGLYKSLSRLSIKGQNSWRRLLSELIFREHAFSVEAVAEDGRELQCDGAVFHADAPFLLITLTDISLLKSEEKKRLEAINFLSHDLRSPMSSVLALIGDSNSRNENAKLLQSIEDIMERSINYADNFIYLSKIESNAYLNFSFCMLDSILDSAVAQLFSLAKSRGIRFQLTRQDDEVLINGDPVMLERAFLNLIDNAIKYGGDNGVVEIETCCKGGVVQVDVTDSGEGASEEELESLFDAFRQGRNARSNRISGAGLGLRLSASVIARHGGDISASNISGKGLRICVELPLPDESSNR
ncbi:CHASE2 and HATPase_c domain-containing protein [Porticoccus sp. W117]|uniref:CHASE2 and HATPase_c domain-containing protein n=1 Tax=Porticoccus sp. W117 TaxID=3054777 RepID=UPI002599D4F9|nr:CHASE2 and HATPase_c domain-containing protein [Porticoccus sp. W117]MDM3870184.1 CHASE2 and HATPase_c domain-containing protein [Porticoccus sp. W117]